MPCSLLLTETEKVRYDPKDSLGRRGESRARSADQYQGRVSVMVETQGKVICEETCSHYLIKCREVITENNREYFSASERKPIYKSNVVPGELNVTPGVRQRPLIPRQVHL